MGINITELKGLSSDRLIKLDLIVLLELLYRAGLDDKDIIFQSHLSFSQSDKLIEQVIFNHNKVLIILNLGIFSANSALPNHILDFFSMHSDSVSFNVVNALASKLLKNQINILLAERCADLDHIYLNGDVLFTRNDSFFYSASSFNSIFERAFLEFNINVRSQWNTDFVDKLMYLNHQSNFKGFHLGNKILSPKLHFDLTIQSEVLFDKTMCDDIAKRVDNLVLSKFFDLNRRFISVSIWLIVHPVKLVFLPFNLSDKTVLTKKKIKIYERNSYGY